MRMLGIAMRALKINEGRKVYDGPTAGLTNEGEAIDDAFARLTY